MGTGRLPAALPQFSFQSGDPNSEVYPVPAPISIEESPAQPPLDESWPKNISAGGMQVRKRSSEEF